MSAVISSDVLGDTVISKAVISVVGEALVDLVAEPDRRTFTAHPGGGPANAAIAVARLGGRAVLSTHLGDDLFGAVVRAHLDESGVSTVVLPSRAGAATSVAFAATDEHGVATYDFRVAWDVEAVPPVPGARFLHTGSLAAALAPGVVESAMRAARAAGVPVSFDPNIRPTLAGRPEVARSRFERQVGLADVVKVSEEDLDWLYPGTDPERRAEALLILGPRLVVLTRGPRGALAVTTSLAVERPAPPTTVVDTVGAGDAFTAGLLCALVAAGGPIGALDEPTVAGALDLANAVGALTCARPGADPPRRADLGAWAHVLDGTPSVTGPGESIPGV
ncbi:carbohydrate kinase family protein [Actinokineospora diospyrosa]|uniref:Fructokinase n=1 Tax=Actinokineospora diospyrosa TaxID=103728 RepID=A0ABT1IPB4_9PSEU|nr:carbohydrate kinase [Actinokineospora diospyrosa]MCP2274296.1 fructokinase [Actinokineospora diospyrosa]